MTSVDYNDPDRNIAVSLNVLLPDSFISSVALIHSRAISIYPEQRNYDVTPHLAILTKFMPEQGVEEFVNVITTSSSNEKAYLLNFQSIIKAELGTYIFLEPDVSSRNRLIELREKALIKSKGIGFETPNNEPAKYPYEPHISIIKLANSEEVSSTLHFLVSEFIPIQTTIRALYISKEARRADGYADFPTIATINLLPDNT